MSEKYKTKPSYNHSETSWSIPSTTYNVGSSKIFTPKIKEQKDTTHLKREVDSEINGEKEVRILLNLNPKIWEYNSTKSCSHRLRDIGNKSRKCEREMKRKIKLPVGLRFGSYEGELGPWIFCTKLPQSNFI